MGNKKDLRSMDLFEEVRVAHSTYVMRVAGGHIYTNTSETGPGMSSVFVPLSIDECLLQNGQSFEPYDTEHGE